jgi:hypothetical protein
MNWLGVKFQVTWTDLKESNLVRPRIEFKELGYFEMAKGKMFLKISRPSRM